jgi:hypothetical protein
MMTWRELGSIGEPVQDHSKTGAKGTVGGRNSHAGAVLAALLSSRDSVTKKPLSANA